MPGSTSGDQRARDHPAHVAAADFTIPYYVTFGQIVIRRGDAPLNGLAELKGKSVSTLKSSQMEQLLRQAGGIDVRSYEEEIDAYSDLKLKRIDATLMDFPIAVYYAQPDRDLQFTGQPVGRIEYGIALKKGLIPTCSPPSTGHSPPCSRTARCAASSTIGPCGAR